MSDTPSRRVDPYALLAEALFNSPTFEPDQGDDARSDDAAAVEVLDATTPADADVPPAAAPDAVAIEPDADLTPADAEPGAPVDHVAPPEVVPAAAETDTPVEDLDAEAPDVADSEELLPLLVETPPEPVDAGTAAALGAVPLAALASGPSAMPLDDVASAPSADVTAAVEAAASDEVADADYLNFPPPEAGGPVTGYLDDGEQLDVQPVATAAPSTGSEFAIAAPKRSRGTAVRAVVACIAVTCIAVGLWGLLAGGDEVKEEVPTPVQVTSPPSIETVPTTAPSAPGAPGSPGSPGSPGGGSGDLPTMPDLPDLPSGGSTDLPDLPDLPSGGSTDLPDLPDLPTPGGGSTDLPVMPTPGGGSTDLPVMPTPGGGSRDLPELARP